MSRLQRVLEVVGEQSARVRDTDGREQTVSLLAYDGPHLAVGDWLIAQSGFALETVGDEEARAALAELGRIEVNEG